MQFQVNDGGRAEAGFIGEAGDCVTRAIAIALDQPYREVYDALSVRMAATGKPRSARNGIPRKVFEGYLGDHGWRWFPTMQIGSGCTVHLRADELPDGRIIARVSKHLCAVIDGVIHDTHDPSRHGTRCVYGYFKCEVVRWNETLELRVPGAVYFECFDPNATEYPRETPGIGEPIIVKIGKGAQYRYVVRREIAREMLNHAALFGEAISHGVDDATAGRMVLRWVSRERERLGLSA